jgi:hypothetical protein
MMQATPATSFPGSSQEGRAWERGWQRLLCFLPLTTDEVNTDMNLAANYVTPIK